MSLKVGGLFAAFVLVVLAAPVGAVTVDERPTPPSPLAGIDLRQPSQQAFAAWPGAELQERPYWIPWSSAVIQRAVAFDRPIFFVMTVPWSRAAQRFEKETLADASVLRAVNSGFLSVAVSADRRPDVRERYQSGTWPVVQLLLPDGRPMLSQANAQGAALPISFGFVDAERMLFYLKEGSVYFGKWATVLRGVADVYDERVAQEVLTPGAVRAGASDQVVTWLLGSYDARLGGFEAAPKYLVGGLTELSAAREARGVSTLEEAARQTIEKLLVGPLYDRRHGGLHRVAVARDYVGIQYEKLLRVQVELLREITASLRRKDSAALRNAARETVRFLDTTLARPGGGFYLAQLADPSSTDGGAYWKSDPADHATPPGIDRLVLAGPNALAGATLIRTGRLLAEPSWVDTGRRALDLVVERSIRPGQGVDHVVEPIPEPWRFLESQAETAFALMDAYETTGESKYLSAARDVADFCLNNLRSPDERALRDFLPLEPPVGLLRIPRHPMEPNALLARVLLRLTAAGQGPSYAEAANVLLSAYAGDLAAYRVHGILPALAVEEASAEPLVIEIRGRIGDPDAEALRDAALSIPRTWSVVRTSVSEDGRRAEAVLRLGGATRRVSDPAKVAPEAAALSRGGVELK